MLAPFVYDSWGTIGGLAGSVLLFGPILFATTPSERGRLSLFFVASSIGMGVLASVLWDVTYAIPGQVGSGSSGIAITALGVLFSLSLLGLFRLLRADTRRLGPLSSHWWYSLLLIYLTLILSTLWFVFFLQPVFVATTLYNWRVHELGFVLGMVSAVPYAAARWQRLGLDGVVRIDETLSNSHFDDLSIRFPRRLPKYHVVFRPLQHGYSSEFHPELKEIWLSESFEGKDYAQAKVAFEGALLHAMVHAELFVEGGPWEHGRPECKSRFDAVATALGAPLEE